MKVTRTMTPEEEDAWAVKVRLGGLWMTSTEILLGEALELLVYAIEYDPCEPDAADACPICLFLNRPDVKHMTTTGFLPHGPDSKAPPALSGPHTRGEP